MYSGPVTDPQRSSSEESLSSNTASTIQREATESIHQNQYENASNVSNKQNKQGVRPKSPNRQIVPSMTQSTHNRNPASRNHPSQRVEDAGLRLEDTLLVRRPAEHRPDRSANLTASNESLNDIANRTLAQSLHKASIEGRSYDNETELKMGISETQAPILTEKMQHPSETYLEGAGAIDKSARHREKSGKVLIINNYEFDTMLNRRGADKDTGKYNCLIS